MSKVFIKFEEMRKVPEPDDGYETEVMDSETDPEKKIRKTPEPDDGYETEVMEVEPADGYETEPMGSDSD